MIEVVAGVLVGAAAACTALRARTRKLRTDLRAAEALNARLTMEAQADEANLDRLRDELALEMQLHGRTRSELAAARAQAQAAQTQALDLQRQLRELKGRRARHREAEQARRDERAAELAGPVGAPKAKAVRPWR